MKFLVKFILILFIINTSYGQDTIRFDGTFKNTQIIVHSRDFKDIQKMNIWFGAVVGADRVSFGGLSYYEPNKFQLNSYFGLGGGVDGTYFIKNWQRPHEPTYFLGYGGNNRYVAEIPAIKGMSIGPHFGLSYFQQMYTSRNIYKIQAGAVAVGFSIFGIKHWNLKITPNNGSWRGSRIVGLHLDAMWYPVHKYPVPKGEQIVPIGQDTLSNLLTQVEFDAIHEPNKNNLGARLYLDGNTTFISQKGIIGFKYFFGVSIAADKRSMFVDVFGLTYGAGIYFNFL